jgi:RNA polymerase sigma-70 factor (ECF subfamily)
MIAEPEVQKLVSEAARGSSNAFGQIYDLLAPKVYNFIFSRIRHKPTAEDLLHTVFLKAWNNIGRYKPTKNAKFSTWLFQIANYTIIDHWRTNKETSELEKFANSADLATEQKLYENYDYLMTAIDELPEDYKTVLNLRFMQDLSIEEVAHIMNKTQVGIRVLQHRALNSLRKILLERGYGNI